MAGNKNAALSCGALAILMVLLWSGAARGDGAFGGTGGGPIVGALTVRVVEGTVEDAFGSPVPIEGAMVMVGLREGDPFIGNVGLTDPEGYLTFIDPALDGPQTVTAGAGDHGYFSLVGVDAAEVVLPLGLFDVKPATAEVQGMWTGFSAIHCDEKMQVGATIPTVSLPDLMAFDIESLLGHNTCIDFPLIGSLPIPGALVIPNDRELPGTPLLCGILGIPINKPSYLVEAPVGATRDLFALAGQVGVGEVVDLFLGGGLSYGELIALLEPLEIGIVRDLYVDGPLSRNIEIETPLSANLTVQVDGTPAGSDVFLVSVGEINGDPAQAPGAGDLLFTGMGFREGGVPGSDLLSTAPAEGALSDMRYLAAAVALVEYRRFSALVDRTGFTPPATVSLDTFLSLVELSPVQGGRFTFTDAANPGVSPDPDLQVSELSLILTTPGEPLPCDPYPAITEKRPFWTVHTPGEDIAFDLPRLPEWAPLAIPYPDETPETDWLEWTHSSVVLGMDGAFDFDVYDFDRFVETVTHMSGDTVGFTFDSDFDEVPFPRDNCPLDSNPDQADMDGDGEGDACDPDADGDGHLGAEGDCDDLAEETYPGAPEICDRRDNDCDGAVPLDEIDHDFDGYVECGPWSGDHAYVVGGLDCDDLDDETYPGAPELCDREDNDCDGVLGFDEVDWDGDDFVPCIDDCDDGDPAVHPGAPDPCDGVDQDCDASDGVPEVCDGEDNDCDGGTDEGFDRDGDGFTSCADPVPDCNDFDGDIFPGAPEICDGRDSDCDGAPGADEADEDGDGVMICEGDCDDADPAVRPGAPEICDGKDSDCDGAVGPEEVDEDGDGSLVCGGDCDDADPGVYPDAVEVCDGIDQDCDGVDGGPELCTSGIDEDCDGLVDSLDPDCPGAFVLELDATYAGGTLSLAFTLGTPSPATWVVYMILTEPSVRIVPLWSLPRPVIEPAEQAVFEYPLPSMG